jgi:hypothetical protein
VATAPHACQIATQPLQAGDGPYADFGTQPLGITADCTDGAGLTGTLVTTNFGNEQLLITGCQENVVAGTPQLASFPVSMTIDPGAAESDPVGAATSDGTTVALGAGTVQAVVVCNTNEPFWPNLSYIVQITRNGGNITLLPDISTSCPAFGPFSYTAQNSGNAQVFISPIWDGSAFLSNINLADFDGPTFVAAGDAASWSLVNNGSSCSPPAADIHGTIGVLDDGSAAPVCWSNQLNVDLLP